VEDIQKNTDKAKNDGSSAGSLNGDSSPLDPEPPGGNPGSSRPRQVSGRLKIGITYNLKKNISSEIPDAEAELDDIDTIRAIEKALGTADFDVTLYEATEDLWLLLKQNRPDMVFNIAEGMTGRGREAHVPAILNFLGIPFTGSDETTLCIAMDKALTKRIVASHGVKTPKYQVVKNSDSASAAGFIPDPGLSWPVIIKPNSEGSSKGISDLSIVKDSAALRRVLAEKLGAYREDMLLEEYINGREFTVGILGNAPNLRVFSPMEILFNENSNGIYSREVKKDFRKYVSYKCPPDISAGLRKEMESTAETIFNSLECRDFARIDFRLSPEKQLYFIEINPLPGLAPGYSDFPMLAEFNGMDYTALIRNIADSALARHGLRRRV